jgi:hypothetical protein
MGVPLIRRADELRQPQHRSSRSADVAETPGSR